VLTWYCSGLRGISQEGRYVLFAGSLIGALVATVLVAIGVNALLQQSKQPGTAPTDRIEPPAIGW
jgi:hypothetical protein